jgi:hypothetical protein
MAGTLRGFQYKKILGHVGHELLKDVQRRFALFGQRPWQMLLPSYQLSDEVLI